jgi:hypothetical protein
MKKKTVEDMVEEMAAASVYTTSLWVGLSNVTSDEGTQRMWNVQFDNSRGHRLHGYGATLAEATAEAYAEMVRSNRAKKARKK